jgi:hypothetical protein
MGVNRRAEKMVPRLERKNSKGVQKKERKLKDKDGRSM